MIIRTVLVKLKDEWANDAERVALAGFFVLLLLVRRYAWSSEADVDELSMLRGSPPVRIRLPGHVPPGAGRFSRWRCVGDLEDPASFVRRTCIFEHVCYDTADEGDFLFFMSCSIVLIYLFLPLLQYLIL